MSAAVSADQLNSFLEKLDILCEKLKVEDCPICDLKLSEDKVSCVNGHGICPSCKLVVNVCPSCSSEYPGDDRSHASSAHPPSKRPRQSAENGESVNGDGDSDNSNASSSPSHSVTGNVVGNTSGRKCANAARGCQVCLTEEEVITHEATCTFRLYVCKICNVEFCLRKLQGHCERSHPRCVIKNSSFKVVSFSEAQSGEKVYYFIQACNEIFWFWRNNTDRLVFIGLQFCGDVEKASAFKYTLDVVSVNQKSSMKFGGPALFDTSEMPCYSPSEDYVMVANNFFGTDSKFKITITKV